MEHFCGILVESVTTEDGRVSMAQENPQEQSKVPGFERFAEAKFWSYGEACWAKDSKTATIGGKQVDVSKWEKVKIFARSNGSFDVVWYRRKEQPQAASKAQERRTEKLKERAGKK